MLKCGDLVAALGEDRRPILAPAADSVVDRPGPSGSHETPNRGSLTAMSVRPKPPIQWGPVAKSIRGRLPPKVRSSPCDDAVSAGSQEIERLARKRVRLNNSEA